MMTYLFGDSTPSPLKSNFLEFFRDAVDFSVFALQTDDRIKQGRERARGLRREADAEMERLEAFVGRIAHAIDEAPKGAPDSQTAECASQLKAMNTEVLASRLGAVRQKLAAAVAKLDADEAAERNACREALGALLLPHAPPDASTLTRLVLSEVGAYEASRGGQADLGLRWMFELSTAETFFAVPARIEQWLPVLEIRAPQQSGWITKEVKLRPQRLERHVVTELLDDGEKVSLKLRTEPGAEAGFDLEATAGATRVTIARVGSKDDTAAGSFEIQTEDVPKLIELVSKVQRSVADLKPHRLALANVDDADFAAQPSFVDFVERLVAMMGPIVCAIAERTVTKTELILRRELSGDRREEIFVAKTTIRAKYAPLPPALRAKFTPLGLESTPERIATSGAPPADPSPLRSELPPSKPPPPPSKTPSIPVMDSEDVVLAALPVAPTPEPASTRSSGASAAPSRAPLVQTPPPAPRASAPAQASVAPSAPRSAVAEASATTPSTLSRVFSADAQRGDPSPSQSELGRTDGGGSKNDALIAAVKQIVGLIKKGSMDQAYREYAGLFSSEAFAECRPEAQRHALKLMVLGKTPPTTDAVLDAHRAALVRLKSLVDKHGSPSDYEMLGVTQMVLNDQAAASKTFATALAIEREQSPQSELCGALMRRVSSL